MENEIDQNIYKFAPFPIQKNQYRVRWMVPRDLPAVLKIERLSYSVPWTKGEMDSFLRQNPSIAMTVEDSDGKVAGYVFYSVEKKAFKINNLTVHPSLRRLGVGTSICNKFIDKLSTNRRERILIGCHDTSLGAHLFLRSQGFRCIKVNKQNGNCSDIYLFEYCINKPYVHFEEVK